jgi:aspartate/methionine/tyrosine aminotransferase
MLKYTSLTQHEKLALEQEFNYTNAFNQISQTVYQIPIIDQLPRLWLETERNKQQIFEERFLQVFYGIRRIRSGLNSGNIMLHYAASIAILHVANYLSNHHLSVSLIEPCFDSIFQVLRNQNVKVSALPEELLYDSSRIYDNLLYHVKTDAIFLVDPNNPTGFTTLGDHNRHAFNEIIRFCKDQDKLLIFDHCFAPFLLLDSQISLYDTYDVLENSGISYIVIEDTGKFFPTQGIKVSIVKMSPDLYDGMYEIYNGYLLSVSPFVLNFITTYITASFCSNFSQIRDPIEQNRSTLETLLKGQIIDLVPNLTKTSVAWCEIKSPHVQATDLQEFLQIRKKVHILPGTFFYWDNPEQGGKYLRIALARNTDNFKKGMSLLVEGVQEFSESKALINV